ncbi:hypothetical protein REPUB_Repub16aG0096700 [Reevesia pubescens]
MDRQEVITYMALELVLERERQKKRLMQESLRAQQVALQEKVRERSMLTKLKQGLLAKEDAAEKLVDDFIGAIENNELGTAQNFDEKAMMNTIVTMLNCNSSDNGGFSGDYGDNVPKIALDPEEKATVGAVGAVVKYEGSCGGDNGQFTGDYEGINDDPVKETRNLGALDGTNSDGGEDSDADGYDGSLDSDRRK